MQYNKSKQKKQNSLSYHRKARKMLNPNKLTKPKTTHIFKNCSYVCAYHCVQLSYTTQHRTVLISCPVLSSKQSLLFRCCLMDGREKMSVRTPVCVSVCVCVTRKHRLVAHTVLSSQKHSHAECRQPVHHPGISWRLSYQPTHKHTTTQQINASR